MMRTVAFIALFVVLASATGVDRPISEKAVAQDNTPTLFARLRNAFNSPTKWVANPIAAYSYTYSYTSSSTYDNTPCGLGVVGTPVNVGQVMSDTTSNGVPAPSGLAYCGSTNSHSIVWYEFVGQGETVTASTLGSSVDTYVSVYDCNPGKECIGFNDDSCSTLSAQLTFFAENGRVYYIAVSGYNNAAGDFVFRVYNGDLSCSSSTSSMYTSDMPPMSSGMETSSSYSYSSVMPCSGTAGTSLFINSVVTGNLADHYTTYTDVDCGSLYATEGDWFTFMGTGQTVSVTTTGSSFDTYVKVYDCFGSSSSAECLVYNDDCGGSLSAVATFYAESGINYYIFLTGYSNQKGDYSIEVSSSVISCGSAIAK